MGQEITSSRFTEKDYEHFSRQLRLETEELRQWFKNQAFSQQNFVAGLELEAWLLDQCYRPSPVNENFLTLAQSEYLTPELARFNIELNVDPLQLKQDVLSQLEQSLRMHWNTCQETAAQLDAKVLVIGILPTLCNDDLTKNNMSKMVRYEALNEQVLARRNGRPIHLHIIGKQNLQSTHSDVMLEAGATSLQIHIQVPQDKAVAYYNSSIFISALMVAATANSPFLFGKSLWEETRIPLFEQAVDIGGFADAAYGPVHRVSFGSGYCRQSLMECFDENTQHFPVLLPMAFEKGMQHLEHLRLHNGTIWRWNRPIIGFNDGEPHLRIEHRVIPSGPTIRDQIANVALYYGLVRYFAEHHQICEQVTEFATARDNFYQAARHGLSAHIKWLDGKRHTIQQLFLTELLDKAYQGLEELGVLADDARFYLDIIKKRIESGQTGSQWQQLFVQRHGDDMALLTRQYWINQNKGQPVHEWDLEIDNAE